MGKILALACSFLLAACIATSSGETRLDLRKLHAHVDAAELTFNDTAVALESTDPELADQLNLVADKIAAIDTQIEKAIASGNGVPDTITAIDLFMEATVSLLEITSDDPKAQARARLAIVAIRAIMAQVKIALEQGAATPP